MDINEIISYDWPYEWNADDMGMEKPLVNRLMKAMIEKDVQEMDRLFSNGATIQAMDKATFRSALFYLLGDYSVIRCLVEHGFTNVFGSYDETCLEPETYSWGILARAWYLDNYDVFELLAQNGFSNLYICSKGEEYYGEELIIKNNDVKAVRILLENGYPRDKFINDGYIDKYPDNDVINYLMEHPIIHRKTIALDSWKFKEIPEPKLIKPGLFNRRSVEYRNSIIMEDYKDRIDAQNRFKEELGIKKWKEIIEERKEIDELVTEFYRNSNPELFMSK